MIHESLADSHRPHVLIVAFLIPRCKGSPKREKGPRNYEDAWNGYLVAFPLRAQQRQKHSSLTLRPFWQPNHRSISLPSYSNHPVRFVHSAGSRAPLLHVVSLCRRRCAETHQSLPNVTPFSTSSSPPPLPRCMQLDVIGSPREVISDYLTPFFRNIAQGGPGMQCVYRLAGLADMCNAHPQSVAL